MKIIHSAIIIIFLLSRCVLSQYNEEEEEDIDSNDYSNVYSGEYFPAVAVASFTGPNIVGEFSFSQDTLGEVVATGAFQKGLKQDVKYKFSFYDGPSCEELGQVLLEHEFYSMHAVNMGGTPPIQEIIPDIHLTGDDGYIGAPWVLSDNRRNLACVMLKSPDSE